LSFLIQFNVHSRNDFFELSLDPFVSNEIEDVI